MKDRKRQRENRKLKHKEELIDRRNHCGVKDLTAEIIREFVEKVYVHQMERIDSQKVQRIRIIWNCIGEFTPPAITQKEKSA